MIRVIFTDAGDATLQPVPQLDRPDALRCPGGDHVSRLQVIEGRQVRDDGGYAVDEERQVGCCLISPLTRSSMAPLVG